MPVSEELRLFAEAPERYVEIPAATTVERRCDDARCIIWDHLWATVTSIDVAPDAVDELVADVRRTVPARCESLWHLGPSSRPANLHEQLLACGLVPPSHRPAEVRALVLTHEPGAVDGVDVRPLETFAQYVESRELAWEAFGAPEGRRALERPLLREEFDDLERTGLPRTFLAYVDGRLAGSAVSVPSPRGVLLGGGSVAPWARGRGLYRALVRRRWEDAAERGTPALVTHANPKTSYRILLRLGFEEVGTIRRLQDRAQGD